jgi:hypothetical protein
MRANEDDEDEEDERIYQEGCRMTPSVRLKPSTKSRRGSDPFIKVPLWWAVAAAKATRNPKFLVCIEMLHRAWKCGGSTFLLPNDRLEKNGAGRKAKYRVLRDLEAAGLITVEWRRRKSPRVTLVLL